MTTRRGLPVWLGVLVASLLAVGGCSSGGSGGAPTTSPAGTDGRAGTLTIPQGFGVVTVVVTRADGTTEEWCMWSAYTSAQRQRGLMDVSDVELGGRSGMVFTFDGDVTTSFYMRSTLLPLSIAWYGADGALVSTADMEPCPPDAETCPTTAPGGRYRYAIEVPQGRLGLLGLVEGATISVEDGCGSRDQAA